MVIATEVVLVLVVVVVVLVEEVVVVVVVMVCMSTVVTTMRRSGLITAVLGDRYLPTAGHQGSSVRGNGIVHHTMATPGLFVSRVRVPPDNRKPMSPTAAPP
eukprot:m.424160 g.424160  ORF g.424160 m.424160 type:complete len:102 (+) comp20212_c1_seq13:944-1249(+)